MLRSIELTAFYMANTFSIAVSVEALQSCVLLIGSNCSERLTSEPTVSLKCARVIILLGSFLKGSSARPVCFTTHVSFVAVAHLPAKMVHICVGVLPTLFSP